MARNKLSIYLIKEGKKDEEIFNNEKEVKILKEYSENKKAFYVPSSTHKPIWLEKFFFDE